MIIRLVESGYLPLREVYQFTKLIRDYLGLQKDIYLEISDQESFDNHFMFVKENPSIYDHATDRMKPPQGHFSAEPDPRHQFYPGCYHNLCVCDNANWREILIHEMIHAHQSETMGHMIWSQLGDIYTGNRKNDPTEAHASFMAQRIMQLYNDHKL